VTCTTATRGRSVVSPDTRDSSSHRRPDSIRADLSAPPDRGSERGVPRIDSRHPRGPTALRGLGWRLDPAAWVRGAGDLWHTVSPALAPRLTVANLGLFHDKCDSSKTSARTSRGTARHHSRHHRKCVPDEQNDTEFLEQLGTEQVRHELADLDQLSISIWSTSCVRTSANFPMPSCGQQQIVNAVTDNRGTHERAVDWYVGAGTATPGDARRRRSGRRSTLMSQ